jgi:hypothetical protein
VLIILKNVTYSNYRGTSSIYDSDGTVFAVADNPGEGDFVLYNYIRRNVCTRFNFSFTRRARTSSAALKKQNF